MRKKGVKKWPFRGFVALGFKGEKNEGRAYYRSWLELRFLRWLEASSEVARYRVEPLSVSGMSGAKRKRYKPDFLIMMEKGPAILTEIRSKRRARDPREQWKYQAAIVQCSKTGWRWALITEADLGQLEAGKVTLESLAKKPITRKSGEHPFEDGK